MVSDAVEAHCPAFGVKVQVVVVVLSNAGDHNPVMPFNEVVGSAIKTSPAQIAATGLKVGKVLGFTVTVILAWFWQAPLDVMVQVVVVVGAAATLLFGKKVNPVVGDQVIFDEP